MRKTSSNLRSRSPHRTKPSVGETPVNEPSHLELKIWLRLLGCTARIENYLRAQLHAEFGITLARFDLLAQLDRYPDGVSMSDISRLLLVSNGAVTGLVDRLVAEGMVIRKAQAGDRRTFLVRFTPSGRQAFAKMAKRHEEWVLSLLGDLSTEAKQQLLGHLVLLKRRLEDAAY